MASDDLTLYYGEILLLHFRLLSFVMSFCLFALACLLVLACINHIIIISLSLFAPASLLVPACINHVMFNGCMHSKNVTTPTRIGLQHLD